MRDEGDRSNVGGSERNGGRGRHVALWLAIVALWLVFIWGHSLVSGAASRGESSRVMVVLRPAFQAAGVTSTHTMTFVIRKTAHFLEYLVLGLLCGRTRSEVLGQGRRSCFPASRECVWQISSSDLRLALLTVMVGCVAPVVDETIQVFVPGRSSQLRDVIIDLCGVLVGTLLAAALRRVRRGHEA
ncbi:MAG: VanZ family protein [Parafannyhessea sp.]|uniref:VanZ family protein n=1 Tax=Parafannyhessea sp. TaxID=2847324 RepID=UPI003F003424